MHLEARTSTDDATPDVDQLIAFRFHYEDQDPDVAWAARIAMDGEAETGTLRQVTPSTPFQRRSKINATRAVINFFPNGNGSLAIDLSNGEVFRTHERGTERRGLKRVRELVLQDSEQNGSDVSDKTESPQ